MALLRATSSAGRKQQVPPPVTRSASATAAAITATKRKRAAVGEEEEGEGEGEMEEDIDPDFGAVREDRTPDRDLSKRIIFKRFLEGESREDIDSFIAEYRMHII